MGNFYSAGLDKPLCKGGIVLGAVRIANSFNCPAVRVANVRIFTLFIKRR